jgi:hypothetical protein
LNRIYELIPSPEESVVPRILLLVHQAVDENFPTAEQAGRQFSKTVFSDELVEQTAGDRSNPSEEGFSNPSPPASGYAKASTGGPGVEFSTKSPPSTVPPRIPPPPAAKSLEKKETTSPSPLPHTFVSSNPPSDSQSVLGDQNTETAPSRPREPDDQTPDNTSKRREKNNKGRSAEPDRSGEKKPLKSQPTTHVDWTTRITLALLLAGLLLLGYVILL